MIYFDIMIGSDLSEEMGRGMVADLQVGPGDLLEL